MLLLIDNYDSFVFNLARYFERLGQDTVVRRNDAVDVAAVRALRPDAIVLSPGPCTPREAGCSLEIVREFHEETPILGVCLGHQAIAAALGGRVIRAREPMHGRTSRILHDAKGVFAGISNPFSACRYHSLVVEESSLPDNLRITARTADGVVMALAHRQLPVIGVQFHPESVLTEQGYAILANFLHLARLSKRSSIPSLADERAFSRERVRLPNAPVTF
jgi:anthranilate synthase component II